jgi:hypothetical protein
LTIIVIIVIIIIDIYPVNCTFPSISNLIFVSTRRIVMRSLNLGLTPSIPPDTALHNLLVFFESDRSLCAVSVGMQDWMFQVTNWQNTQTIPFKPSQLPLVH